MRKITYGQAICEAIDEEMDRDKNVIFLGEDIEILGGILGLLQGYTKNMADGELEIRLFLRIVLLV